MRACALVLRQKAKQAMVNNILTCLMMVMVVVCRLLYEPEEGGAADYF